MTIEGMIHPVRAMKRAQIFDFVPRANGPVLIVCGDADRITPVDGCAAELRAAQPRSSLVVIGGRGPIVSTGALNGLLAEFLKLGSDVTTSHRVSDQRCSK